MIEDRLKKMIGRKWLYKARNVVIEDVKITPTKIFVVLESDVVSYDYLKASEVFEDFLEVSQNEVLIKRKTDLPINHKVSGGLLEFVDVIKDSINKVQKNASYVKQANSINQSINTIINLAKLEIITDKLK